MLRTVLLVLLSVALVACVREDEGATPDPAPPAATSAVPTVGRYVALGDSFTSGPGIPTVTPESGFCLRSSANYPALLAADLGTQVVDVSCAGATTEDVVTGRNGGIMGTASPPQLDAVTPDTELVTLTIGGNDGILEGLLTACLRGSEATCSTYADEGGPDVLQGIDASVANTLEQTRAKAPSAQVVLVGYLGITPASGTCDALVMSAGTVKAAHRVEASLDSTLADAARTAGARYVSMAKASVGHDACSDDPWVNGAEGVDNSDGVLLHPRRAGMEGVARAVEAALSR